MSKDADNIARLEALRPRYERLKNLKIRTDADVERAEQDLKLAREQAIEVAGTDNEDEIRNQILQNYETNTKLVDEFEKSILAIEAELNAINAAQ